MLRDQCLREHEALTGQARLDWSRQWEYPYVLANLPQNGDGLRILDAGCGLTFFTLLLAEREFEVHACDLDGSIGLELNKAASKRGLSVQFKKQDLSCVDYPDSSFDFIACVSVLEHTADPEAVVKDLHRTLKPDGSLLLTFDISIDGDRDIPVGKVGHLLEVIESYFVSTHPFHDEYLLGKTTLGISKDILKTEWFRHNAPELLPWGIISRSSLRNMFRGSFRRPFFNLAVMGMMLAKKHKPQTYETG